MEKRYFKEDFQDEYAIKKEDIIIAIVDSGSNAWKICGELNALNDENEQLKSKNKELKDKYERKDRQLKRTKKDIEKYTNYFLNELNWDCDKIIKEVFR